MARDAVWRLLIEDVELASLLGIAKANMSELVIPNFAADQRPGGGIHPFIVIRWGADDYEQNFQVGFRRFDLYVHVPWDFSTDYNRIDVILNRCDDIFDAASALQQSAAGDGMILHFIEREGRSGDFKDDGYETICRYASYKALSSRPYRVESVNGGRVKQ